MYTTTYNYKSVDMSLTTSLAERDVDFHDVDFRAKKKKSRTKNKIKKIDIESKPNKKLTK